MSRSVQQAYPPITSGWSSDGYAHERNEHGTCLNCGASKQEYHHKLLPKETPTEEVEFHVGAGFVIA